MDPELAEQIAEAERLQEKYVEARGEWIRLAAARRPQKLVELAWMVMAIYAVSHMELTLRVLWSGRLDAA